MERRAIIAACEALIQDVLRPAHVPAEITPTAFNYLVDITGACAGGRYRFMRHYRSGFEDNLGQEFDAHFARIDRMGRDSFDVHWMRHTGQWWPLHRGLTLVGALQAVATDGVFQPWQGGCPPNLNTLDHVAGGIGSTLCEPGGLIAQELRDERVPVLRIPGG